MKKYRVEYYESEAGWGSDSWVVDYDSEQDAKKAFDDCWNKYMTQGTTPSYYIRPTYVGEVK